MDASLSVVEIRDKFVGEWVLIEDPQTNDAHEILRGRVICHSKDRAVVDREMLAKRPRHFAVLYLGTIPPDMAIVL